VVIGEWERSHHNDSEEIYREGRPPRQGTCTSRAPTRREGVQQRLPRLVFEARARAARVLKFAHLSILSF
jgi:hypothetical protein